MRFTLGDRVRHRGLRFISGMVVDVVTIPDADLEDDRSYFYRVQLRNGQLYSDRATEWEPILESLESPLSESKPDQDGQLYAEAG